MDFAYNQHSPHFRKNNRSSTNLNHLSLAPLTSKLPIHDSHQLPSPRELRTPTCYTSYLEGKSAPVTPGILSRNSSHANLNASLKTKSKSSTQLLPIRTQKAQSVAGASKSGPTTPRRKNRDELSLTNGILDAGNSDWLERAGALLTTQAQESRGQSWLTSRASSTSLTGIHNREADEEEQIERLLALEREREMNRGNSRRNSVGTVRNAYGDGFVADDEFSPISTRMSFGSRFGSRQNSRVASRAGSRRASKAGIAITPLAKDWGKDASGYFDGPGNSLYHGQDIEHAIAEADFVDLEEEEQTINPAAENEGDEQDEIFIKRLARRGNFGVQMFVEKFLGLDLFGLEDEEDAEMTEDDEGEGIDDDQVKNRRQEAQRRYLERVGAELDERVPPPAEGEVGNWTDAAWLLSVASKVLL